MPVEFPLMFIGPRRRTMGTGECSHGIGSFNLHDPSNRFRRHDQRKSLFAFGLQNKSNVDHSAIAAIAAASARVAQPR
ncbi:hypothetical protein VI817_010270 [Penicillium citrinum]|nr:hypothetical protein VI817_010270 [Penicillium citrinum]